MKPQILVDMTRFPNGTVTFVFKGEPQIDRKVFIGMMIDWKERLGLHWKPLKDGRAHRWVILPKHGKNADEIADTLHTVFEEYGVDLDIDLFDAPEDIVWPERRLT